MFVCPEDLQNYRRIVKTLNRGKTWWEFLVDRDTSVGVMECKDVQVSWIEKNYPYENNIWMYSLWYKFPHCDHKNVRHNVVNF